MMLQIFVSLLLKSVYSVKLGEPHEYSRIYPSTAYHIEEDVINQQQLLISTFGSLSSVRQGHEPSVIVGGDRDGYIEGLGSQARFNYISGFRQVNKTHVIVIDQLNHCLRIVDRKHRRTSLLAGKCEVPSFKDGEGSEARFNKPNNLIDGNYLDEYYLTDTDNNAIRLISVGLEHTEVSTLFKNEISLFRPTGLALDRTNNSLYVLVQYDVIRFSILEGAVEPLTSSLKGYKDGTLGSSQFGDSLKMLQTAKDEYLVADWSNNQLRVLNTSHQTVETLPCEDKDGSSKSCQFRSPYSIAFSSNGSRLFIGKNNYIKFVHVTGNLALAELLETRLPRPTTTSTTATTTSDDSTPSEPLEPRKQLTELSWTVFVIMALVILLVILANITLLVILKLRKQRRRAKRNPIYGHIEPNSLAVDSSTGDYIDEMFGVDRGPLNVNNPYETITISQRSPYSMLHPCSSVSMGSQTVESHSPTQRLFSPSMSYIHDDTVSQESGSSTDSSANSSASEDLGLLSYELMSKGRIHKSNGKQNISKSASNLAEPASFSDLSYTKPLAHHRSDQLTLHKGNTIIC